METERKGERVEKNESKKAKLDNPETNEPIICTVCGTSFSKQKHANSDYILTMVVVDKNCCNVSKNAPCHFFG